ncbi:hypothetical protein [Povalibacter sp.]|uniref:hypothetical protein n=1 Tax=Povalibacter sp. TaxID=1962978 RepID=UPI002F42AC81
MIDMLDALFPKESTRFIFTHNLYKSLDIGLGRFIRDQRLVGAFESRKALRKAVAFGDLWIFASGGKAHASYSFAGLLRAQGKDVPAEMFDHVPPALPRHDAGLKLEYASEREIPWQMQWCCEGKRDRHKLQAMTLRALLGEAFAFDARRASLNAKDALDPRPYRQTSH